MGYLRRRIAVVEVTFLLGSICCPNFFISNPNNCFSTDNFHGRYYSSGVLRMLQNTGPFTCFRECLLRRSCSSVNYHPDKSRCELLYSLPGKGGFTIPPEGHLHIEKTQMYSMSSAINALPCYDSLCGEYERCQVMFDNSTACSTTECSPLNVRRVWTTDVNSTLAVGEEVSYYCANRPSSHLATVRCRQSGLWKVTQRSTKNIHQCNQLECLKNKEAIYINRSDRCYSFNNQRTSHKDARAYCQSKSPQSHLLLVDSAEKVQDLKDVLPPYVSIYSVFWVDGIYIHETKTVDIWNGSIPVQNLMKLQAFANIDMIHTGCLSFYASFDEIKNEQNCDGNYLFVCEINIDN